MMCGLIFFNKDTQNSTSYLIFIKKKSGYYKRYTTCYKVTPKKNNKTSKINVVGASKLARKDTHENHPNSTRV